jgi:nicotinamide riboside kinase
MATVIVLYGPKAVGKSLVAQTLAERLGCTTSMSTRWLLTCWLLGSNPTLPMAGWCGSRSG